MENGAIFNNSIGRVTQFFFALWGRVESRPNFKISLIFFLAFWCKTSFVSMILNDKILGRRKEILTRGANFDMISQIFAIS